MIIQKKELLSVLQKVMPGIETGTITLKGADTFVFHDNMVSTYNDHVSCTVPFKTEEALNGCVKADEFFKLISKLSSEEISFVVKDEKTWVLKCGKAKAELTLMDFDYSGRFENIKPEDSSWVEVKDEFKLALTTCKMPSNKSNVAGIYMDGKYVVSTDGNQIHLFKMKECEVPTCWISDDHITEIVKIDKILAIQVKDAWAHFKAEDGQIFSVKVNEVSSYPFKQMLSMMDTDKIDKDNDMHGQFPQEMFSAIDRAVSFSMNISDHVTVRLTVSNDNIEVSSERESGKYKEKVLWEKSLDKAYEPIVMYVDAEAINFAGQRTRWFYIEKGPKRGNHTIPRLLFYDEQSKHLLGTLDNGDEE